MAKKQPLSKAPIKEAIIEFCVVLPKQTTIEVLGRELSQLESDYPNKEQLIKGSFDISLDKDISVLSDPEQQIEGYRFSSVNRKQVVQFRLNGFAFSRLEPYRDWEQISDFGKK